MNLTDETIRHAIAGLLDTAPDPSPNPPAALESAATGFARRSVRPWLAVAGLTVAAVVVIVAVTIRSTSDERVATVAPADTTIDTSAYTTNAAAAAPLFDTGPSPVQWETFNPPGVAAVRLTTLTAGPGGFVATGGSAGDPRGHLWFSTDATTWTEPAAAVFAPITHVAAALATSDWFFIYGAPDSTTSEAIGPWQLFRSADGQTWTPIPSTADTPGIASFTSVGNTLIRWNPLTEETAISTDGQQWTPADTQFIPVFPGSRARGAGTTFFTGLVDDTLTAFVSVRNGQWARLDPQPDHVGYLVNTPAGIFSFGQRPDTACDTDTQPTTTFGPNACPLAQTLEQRDTDSGTWTTIADNTALKPAATPIVFGNRLFAPITDPQPGLVSSTDGINWDPVGETLTTSGAVRPEAWVAQHTDTAVIAITNLNPTGGGANTTLLVGRIPTTPTPPAGDGPTSTFRNPARDVRVLIANAAGIPGIAGQLSQVLPDHYIVPTPTTATIDFSQPLTQTQVLYRPGFDQQAATLAEDLGATTAPLTDSVPLDPEELRFDTPDLVVLLGTDHAAGWRTTN